MVIHVSQTWKSLEFDLLALNERLTEFETCMANLGEQI